MAKRFKPVTPLLPGFEPEDGENRPAPEHKPAERPAATVAARTASHSEAEITAILRQQTRVPGPPPQSLAGQTVWVIDAHSLIHQVFHALPEMSSPRGEPVAAVYGFTRDLFYLLESKRPDFWFCAFDMPGKTFRHAMYDQYKIQRPAMHEDLVPQIHSCHRVVQALGIPALGLATFEADDLLATIAGATEQLDGRCFLVSGDKDCRQLISERVKLYNIRKNEILDREALQKDWGISPQQVVDYLALVGDASDHVPGVPSVGPVYARQLLEKYGDLEGIFAHVGELTAVARRENLIKFQEQAMLSRRLVQLDAHVPVVLDWKAARLDSSDLARALALFEEFGFRSLAEKLATLCEQPVAAAAPAHEKPTYHLVDTAEKLAALLAPLRQQTRISVDTETTSVWPRWAELVGMSLAWNDREAWYLPFRAPAGQNHLDLSAALEALRPVLENPAIEKIGQNLKYDLIVFRGAGIRLAGAAFDTMVASYLLDAGQRNHNLNELAKRYLQHATIKIEELIGSGKQQKRMDEVPLEQMVDYAAEDALLPVRLQPILARKLADSELGDLFTKVEMPLVEVLAELEYRGIRVDVARLKELSVRFGERMAAIEEEIYALAGYRFNIASPKQMQHLLFVEKKLPVLKRTKTGPSTDVAVLEMLAPQHPLPAKIVEYRQYAKLKGTYVDTLPEMVHPETGRVHASFNQVVAATGRLSSSDPNLQNIPVRTDAGREIRSAFVPGQAGWLLLAADYSQIELRILAHYSQDEQLCAAFAEDQDIHSRVASQVHGVPLEEVTEAMRREAKVVNFGVIYGQTATGLARRLGIDKAAAAQFIDSYFQRYPGIEKFLVTLLAECRKRGYVNTILGRRRAIRGVRENAGRSRNLAERTAVNTVIQGSAADLIKLAMIAIHQRLRREQFSARMLLQIHDELIFEAPAEELPRLAALVREEMVGAARLRVPLKVDLETGPNWADTKPCE